MALWQQAPLARDQMVLFPSRLDEAIPLDHPVRMFDMLLAGCDWSAWEARYDQRRGQPAIHPRVLAGVLMYGLMKRVRSSRNLEEALQVRLDFYWLAEGRSIDHTTFSKFRKAHGQELKKLFVQTGLVAREMGYLPLERLAFDGTRIRANNRRSRTRTPAELRAMQAELEQQYDALMAELDAEDAREDTLFGPVATGAKPLPDREELVRRLRQVEAALDECRRAGAPEPSRIPLTDPESRVSPNKEGGFAPNYTPVVTVDVASGLIVQQDVLPSTNEESVLVSQIQGVQQDFQLEHPSPEMLVDGKNSTGANLQDLAEMGVTLYAPAPTRDPERNPALREDPTQSVPAEQWDQLPTTTGKKPQLTKEAFVYDAEHDCYWCPQAQPLTPTGRTSERSVSTGRRQCRTRYKAKSTACANCPLRNRCLKPGVKRREISRYEHEHLSDQLAERMATPQGQAIYAQRRHAGEFPFAVIKQQFGIRRFLLRGLKQVRQEWLWITTAFNFNRLIALIQSRAGPPRACLSSPSTLT